MNYPTTRFEKQALARGYQCVVGIDEAGRGAWAGPVVAAAVCFDAQLSPLAGITDSKLLTAAQRDRYYQWLTKHLVYGVGRVSAGVIDRIGIVPATRLAMTRAIMKLSIKPDYLLIDALLLPALAVEQLPLIKGDQKSWSIAAASIIAKVTRDRLMASYHHKHPVYGFDRHKGYGTARHTQILARAGVCPLHRRSYRPIHALLHQA